MEGGRPYSRPDVIALFRLPFTLTRRAGPPVFRLLTAEAGQGGWHGPSEPRHAGSVKGPSASIRPDGGISRLHRIGGRWDEGGAGLKPVTLRPGILIAWSCHREALPWCADPVCPARHPRKSASKEAQPPCAYRSGQALGVDGGFGAGSFLRRLLTPPSGKDESMGSN